MSGKTEVLDKSTPNQLALQQQGLDVLSNPANSPFFRFLNSGPSNQAFNFLQNPLSTIIGDTGQGAFDSFMDLLQPQFGRNLNFGLGALNAAAPGAQSSALANQGIDLTTQALQDFNLFAEQSRLNFMNPSLQAAGLLQGASQAASAENMGQFFQPTSSLMNTALSGGFQPGLSEVVQQGGFMDFLTQGILGATGLFTGFPGLPGAIGGALGGLFGGQPQTRQPDTRGGVRRGFPG